MASKEDIQQVALDYSIANQPASKSIPTAMLSDACRDALADHMMPEQTT
jgi:hypothetical protein